MWHATDLLHVGHSKRDGGRPLRQLELWQRTTGALIGILGIEFSEELEEKNGQRSFRRFVDYDHQWRQACCAVVADLPVPYIYNTLTAASSIFRSPTSQIIPGMHLLIKYRTYRYKVFHRAARAAPTAATSSQTSPTNGSITTTSTLFLSSSIRLCRVAASSLSLIIPKL